MRLLVLGGTAFLGRAVARAAIAAGDDVTCAARGVAGAVPDGAQLVRLDRNAPDAYHVLDGHYDAIVDVSSRPSHVRAALTALADRADHWVYVSSASVYTDSENPGQRAANAPTFPAAPPEIDDPFADGYAQYGPCKVACENAVIDAVGIDRTFACRAGLIVGPEDTSGRFTYWPVRFARGGEVLAPGTPDDLVQWVDVRDLADWSLLAARERISGRYDGICAPVTRAEFFAGVAAGTAAAIAAGTASSTGAAATADLTWVDHEFLLRHEVNPWAGPRSLPLWLPLPEYAGFLSRDVSASVAAGLVCRDVADSARATLEWQQQAAAADAQIADAQAVDTQAADAQVTDAPADSGAPPSDAAAGEDPPPRSAGLDPGDETELLAAWHREHG